MFKYGHWVSKISKSDLNKAFVYKITLNIDGVSKYYIGYKTIKGNWNGYKTSSKIVKEKWDCMVSAEITEWFNSADDAHKREIELLTEVSAHTNDDYLNRHIGGVKFNTRGLKFSKETKIKISEKNKKNFSKQYMDNIRTAAIISVKNSNTVKEINNSPKRKEHMRRIGKLAVTSDKFWEHLNSDANRQHLDNARPAAIIATLNSELVRQTITSDRQKEHLAIMRKCDKRKQAIKESEVCKKHLKQMQSKAHEQNKKRCTNGNICFSSVRDAAEFYNINKTSMAKRCRKGTFGWKYI